MVPSGEGHRTQITKGLLDMCLLAIIVEETSYGYGMVQKLNERGWVIANEGSIYPVLKRLTHGNLIESELVASSTGPARKYYSATDIGRETLEFWAADWRSVRDGVDAVLGNPGTKKAAKKSSSKQTSQRRPSSKKKAPSAANKHTSAASKKGTEGKRR